MQNDFVDQGGGLLVPDAEATIPAINALLEVARSHGLAPPKWPLVRGRSIPAGSGLTP
jgi:hypothetical protein